MKRNLIIFIMLAGISVQRTHADYTIDELDTLLDSLNEDPIRYSNSPHLLNLPRRFRRQPPTAIIAAEPFINTLRDFIGHLETSTPTRRPFIQKALLPPTAQLMVFGDIHGSAHSLVRSLHLLMEHNIINNDFSIIAPNVYFIFLGDYIDRGFFSTEALYTLMRLKLANPDKVFLLRGNHDTPQATPTNFAAEITTRYGTPELAPTFYDTFNLLPSALLVGAYNPAATTTDYILFCHGGLPPTTDEFKPFLRDNTTFFMPLSDDLEQAFLWNKFKPTDDAPSLYAGSVYFGEYDTQRWIAENSTTTAAIKFIVHGHQHTEFAPQLEAAHGAFPLWDGLAPIVISAAASGDVWLPYDSFLIIQLAPQYHDWRLIHVSRQVGPLIDTVLDTLNNPIQRESLTDYSHIFMPNTKQIQNLPWQQTAWPLYRPAVS